MSTDDWKSQAFRLNVANKIEDAIRQSGNPTTKTASEMEMHFFQRANTKEEYLNYLARLLIHIKELKQRQGGAGPVGNQGILQHNVQQGQGNMNQQQMMNQMNIRPNLINMQIDQQQMGQLSQNQPQQMNQMTANPAQINPQLGGNQQQMNTMVVNQQQMNQMNQKPNSQLSQQLNQQQMNLNQQQMNQQLNQQQLNPQLNQQLSQQPINQLSNQQQLNQQMGMNQGQQAQQMGGNQFNQNANINMNNPLMQQMGAPNQPTNSSNNANSALLNQLNQTQPQGIGPMGTGMQRPRFPGSGVSATAKMTPQHQLQQQALQQQQLLQQQQHQLIMQQRAQPEMAQNPPTPQFQGPGVASPAQQPLSMAQSMTPMSSGMSTSHMGAPSPAYVHSPANAQVAASPANVRMGAPQQQQARMGGLMPPSPSMNVPTPGMLHTPQGAGMGGAVGTPVMPGASNEDQLYQEKVRQLGRFIEPLTRLINRYGDDDSEKRSKMKIMLDILMNPQKRMPMEVLLKCEAVLERMDFKRSDSGSIQPPSVASVPSLGVAVPAHKDHPPSTSTLHPLLETIANLARSPYINHTLQRTFSPAVTALIGCDIPPPVENRRKRRHESGPTQEEDVKKELMYTIEREIANLDPRFKVDMDPLHLVGCLDLSLECKLEDKYLPSLSPLRILVPRDYPRTSPICRCQQPEYDVSPLTRAVMQGLRERLHHMPNRYTVSQILNCWEMALRHACKPNNTSSPEVSPLIVSMGM